MPQNLPAFQKAEIPHTSNSRTPKTVDNDLPITDNCPGFGSVAKYIAVSTREASFDVASMAETSTKVFVIEVMGRHAGWIAAAGAMASDEKTPIPIIVLFPEIPFNRKKFIAEVKAKVREFGYVSVVVSEGVADKKRSFSCGSRFSRRFRTCPVRRCCAGGGEYG